MARKHNGTDSGELLQFDTRTKAVAAQSHTMDNLKEKVSKVRVFAASSSKDDIISVLYHFDGDVDQSIDAYKRGGTQEIISQWNVPSRRKGGNNQKRNKKKKHKGGSEGGETSTQEVPLNNNNIEKPTHPRIETIGQQQNGHVSFNNNHMPKETSTVQSKPQRESYNRSRGGSPKPRPGSQNPRREPSHLDNQARSRDVQHDSRGPKPSSGQGGKRQQQQQRPNQQQQRPNQQQRPSYQSGRRRNISEGSDKGGKVDRERTVSESSSIQDPSKPKKPSSVLERVSKDLQRTQVSLTRHKNLLNEECDRSEKRLRKAFQDVRLSLEHREMEMMEQLREVKRTATLLLDKRQERALELKMETNRGPSMSDQQMAELKAQIKHFVSDRKVDEEIGRTMRFTWNPDHVEQAIKTLGEVMPIKNFYSTRRPSLTSDTSGTFSRTTSLSEDPSGPLSRSTSRIDSSVPPTPTTPDMDMQAEVENFAARLQRSLDSRGGPRRPRNDRSRSQGRQGKKVDQKGPRNQGNQKPKNDKPAPRNQGQQDRGEQGQQGRRNRGGPNRGKDQAPRRDQNRERLSSSSSTGKGEESPDGSPKKSRSQRRREQYRRRQFDRDGGENGDAKQEPKDVKQEPKDVKPADKDSKPKKVDVKTNNSKSSDKVKDDVKVDDKPLVNGTDVPEAKVELDNDSNSKAERPKELNVTSNEPANVDKEPEKEVNHIDNSSDKKIIPNGDVHKDEPVQEEAPKCNGDTPMMNGGLSSGGEVSPTEPVKESGDVGLPQRQPREPRKERPKVTTEVVKEVSAMNGVVATGENGVDEAIVDH